MVGSATLTFVYYRNRYYDPATGRFISEDPIGWASGQTNAYAYVNGNPVQFSDPFGEAGIITGFTRHGLNQAINRDVSPGAMCDAVNNPISVTERSNGTTRYTGAGAVVVLNPAGRVVTVWGQ
ncbi:RHS repeat-associated core domain-containing protein [Paraburkholderia sediminicola]|uniref:RHS repeat-associated core domain-containing protein n=1 Tax=Paraburkholderia sediminicola TaxID=458836 RepID=UPI0038BADA0E